MIVDSSALIAVIQGEPEARACSELLAAGHCRISAANWLEASIVADSRSITTRRELGELLDLTAMEVVPVSVEHARIAGEAYRRFGRGSGHPAKLNFGDTFAYALSVSTGEALLFVGDDFAHTDVRSASL